ncbi:hypothetical protein IWZ01DRAFT_243667 [Phyllosticta capitalensis]
MTDENRSQQICQVNAERQSCDVVARSAQIPDFSEIPKSRRPLFIILHVGIENILDEHAQPQERSSRHGRSLADGTSQRVLRPGEYSRTFTSLLADIILECDDISHVKPLIRQHIEKRNNNTALRPRHRFVQEVTEADARAALNELRDAKRNTGMTGGRESAQRSLKRKERDDTLVVEAEAPESAAKKSRSEQLAADDEEAVKIPSNNRGSRSGKAAREFRDKKQMKIKGDKKEAPRTGNTLEAQGVTDDILNHATSKDHTGSLKLLARLVKDLDRLEDLDIKIRPQGTEDDIKRAKVSVVENERSCIEKSIRPLVQCIDRNRHVSGVCVSRALRRRVDRLLNSQEPIKTSDAYQSILTKMRARCDSKEPSDPKN